MLINDSNGNPVRLVTPAERPVRFSYLDVFTGKPHTNVKGESVTRYSVAIIIPKQYQDIYQELMQLASITAQTKGVAVWGQQLAQPNIAVHDGDMPRAGGGMYGPECANSWVVNLSTQTAPDVVDENGMQTQKVKSGDWGRVSMTCYPYSNNGNKGISFGLGNIQKLVDGEPLSSGGAASDFGLSVTPQQPAMGAPAAAPAPAYQQPGAQQQTQYAAAQAPVAQPVAPGVPQQGFAAPAMPASPAIPAAPGVPAAPAQQQAPLGYNPGDTTLPF